MKHLGKKASVIFVVFIGLLLFTSCENDIEVIKSITSTNELPQQSAENTEIIYSDSGIVKIRLLAPVLERYVKPEKETYVEFPEGLEVYFYHNEEIESQLTANYVIYYEEQELWEARNNVVAVNKNSETLKTELLFWDQSEHKIYTDKFAKVTDEHNEIQGEGFKANENLTSWEFSKVTGVINIKDEPEQGQ